MSGEFWLGLGLGTALAFVLALGLHPLTGWLGWAERFFAPRRRTLRVPRVPGQAPAEFRVASRLAFWRVPSDVGPVDVGPLDAEFPVYESAPTISAPTTDSPHTAEFHTVALHTTDPRRAALAQALMRGRTSTPPTSAPTPPAHE